MGLRRVSRGRRPPPRKRVPPNHHLVHRLRLQGPRKRRRHPRRPHRHRNRLAPRRSLRGHVARAHAVARHHSRGLRREATGARGGVGGEGGGGCGDGVVVARLDTWPIADLVSTRLTRAQRDVSDASKHPLLESVVFAISPATTRPASPHLLHSLGLPPSPTFGSAAPQRVLSRPAASLYRASMVRRLGPVHRNTKCFVTDFTTLKPHRRAAC